jgi:hypothetical protein
MYSLKHISILKKNLISLGTLEAFGCRYAIEGRVIKVNKGTLVVMKGCKFGSVYTFYETTITIIAVTISILSDSNITKLWHILLEHMSRKCPRMLSKRGLLDGQNTRVLNFYEHCIFEK